MRRQDWLLLALSYAKDHKMSPVQLQKSLFVLGRELPADVGGNFYQFEPYHYGPLDVAIYRDVESLAHEGLLSLPASDGLRWYEITETGRRRAEDIQRQASLRATGYLASVVKWAQALTFPQLVRSIYAQYPETSTESIFRG